MSRIDEGIALLRAGKLEEAARLLQELPEDPDALHLLAVIKTEKRDLEGAEALARRAIEARPTASIYHATLATVLREKGEFARAIASMQRAIELQPERGDLWNNLGLAFEAAGQLADAESAFRRAIALAPELPLPHVNLGRAFRATGKLAEAMGELVLAIALDPRCSPARCALAVLFAHLGQPEGALEQWEAALAQDPDDAQALVDSAFVLATQGRLSEARARAERALELRPIWAQAHEALGHVLMMSGAREEATRAFLKAAQHAPRDPRFVLGAAVSLLTSGAVREGRAALEQVRARAPNDPRVHEALAQAYLFEGQIARAIASAERAIELEPHQLGARSFLLGVAYGDGKSAPEELFAQAVDWGKLAAARNPRLPPARPDRDPDRPLRIGYVSGDFRMHPVGYVMEALIPHHDRAQFTIHCYANQEVEDEISRAIRRAKVEWRRTRGLSSEVFAALVREDMIDILIDLSGHTQGNRLEAFARKPAPVQATWLGYYATTGLSAIDWIVCDERVLPDGEQQWFVERPMRLEGPWICIPRLRIPVRPSPLPSARLGAVTFGCFNNLAKLSDDVLGAWAEILREERGARLALKTHFLSEEEGRRTTIERFRALGVQPERLLLLGYSPRIDTLRAYQDIDVALDPFPYGGGTTTLEALWMGVPVITKRGSSFVSHISEALLSAARCEELVAEDTRDYVRRAVELARDRERLSALRITLRDRLLASPLADAKRFARTLEKAFREMWTAYLRES